MRRHLAVLSGAAGAFHVALGAVLLLVGARALLDLGAPPRLDPGGTWLDDGWARAARGALLVVTGLATLGLVRVPTVRRLAALGLLLVSALGLGLAAGALDLVVLWSGVALATTTAPLAIVVGDERQNASRHALAALLWAGLPGPFSLAVRGTLWTGADAPASLILFVVAGGGFLRVLAVARLVRILYFRGPVAEMARDTEASPAALPSPLSIGIAPRWGLLFAAALGLEFGLGLWAPELARWIADVATAVSAG